MLVYPISDTIGDVRRPDAVLIEMSEGQASLWSHRAEALRGHQVITLKVDASGRTNVINRS